MTVNEVIKEKTLDIIKRFSINLVDEHYILWRDHPCFPKGVLTGQMVRETLDVETMVDAFRQELVSALNKDAKCPYNSCGQPVTTPAFDRNDRQVKYYCEKHAHDVVES